MAQAYIVAALNDSNYIKDTKNLLSNESKYMYNSLSNFKNLIVYKPSANYILANIDDSQITVNDIQAELEHHNTLIRSCTNYKGLGPQWMRIAIKDHDHNVSLISLLGDILTK